LSTGALGVPGKAGRGRDNKARAWFSQIFFFQRESKNLREETPLIFRGRWDGAQIMRRYSHHEGARME
jgi:hypothetical protein